MVHRLVISALVSCAILVSQTAQAGPPGRGGPIGLGIILVEPTGLTGKIWFAKDQAVDMHLGLDDVGRGNDIAFYFDYLMHFDLGVTNRILRMPLYLGPGGALYVSDGGRRCNRFECYDTGDDDLFLAARFPVGFAFLFRKFNGEAFLELVPSLLIVPDIDFEIDGAIGFRYYF